MPPDLEPDVPLDVEPDAPVTPATIQDLYDAPLDQVPTAKPGDFLFMRCTYDNSMSNPYVVDALEEQGLDAPVDVFLGEETLDEMCLGVFGVAYSI